MIPQIEKLTEDEVALMFKAPHLVFVLIAGADDNIDKKECETALAQATYNWQTIVEEPALENFYIKVTKNFVGKLKKMISSYPPDAKTRNPIIADELEKLNYIFPKLEPEFAQLFYDSLINLASEVAKASGGVMGIGSISQTEQQWVDLDMIIPPNQTT